MDYVEHAQESGKWAKVAAEHARKRHSEAAHLHARINHDTRHQKAREAHACEEELFDGKWRRQTRLNQYSLSNETAFLLHQENLRRNREYHRSANKAHQAINHLLWAESALAKTPPDNIKAAHHRNEALKRRPPRLKCGVEPSDDT